MCHLLLIRHASFDGIGDRLEGRSDASLNQQGCREAALVASACQNLGVAALLSSPRRRAVETAAVIAGAAGLDLTVAPLFDEIDYGAWTGRRFLDLEGDPGWREYNSRRKAARIPNGERLEAVTARVRRGLNDVRRRYPDSRVVIVTHAEIIRCALLLAASLSWNHWARFHLSSGSVTLLSWCGTWVARGIGLAPSRLREA
ncbi:MAG: histidine phosphatase family protein [Vicinamibacterales bacterium]